MEMSIDEARTALGKERKYALHENKQAFDIAIDVMCKYQMMQADYENRLKADMVAMLKELKTEMDKQCKIPNNNASAYDWNNGVYACYKVVQQKIDALKEQNNGND
jgi:hypothetical protein